MNRTETETGIPDDIRDQLQRALDNLAGGIRDPTAAKAARERMNRIRAENRRLFGEQDIADELIRQTRDQP